MLKNPTAEGSKNAPVLVEGGISHCNLGGRARDVIGFDVFLTRYKLVTDATDPSNASLPVQWIPPIGVA